jgi:lysozyme
MKVSQAGIDLIKEFEGCHLDAYPDPKTGGDPFTIGWGATGPDVYEGLTWTQEQADERLARDVEAREAIVNEAVTVDLTQGQFDAMVSIVFNVGYGSKRRNGIIKLRSGEPSTLLQKLNDGDYAGAAKEFERWVSPGSPVERGLKRRRDAEVDLFNS